MDKGEEKRLKEVVREAKRKAKEAKREARRHEYEQKRAKEEAEHKRRVEDAGNLKVPITTKEKTQYFIFAPLLDDVKSQYLRKGYCIYQENTWDAWLWTGPCGKPVAPGRPLCPEHTKANYAIIEQERKSKLEEYSQERKLKLEEERKKEEQHQLLIIADAKRSIATYWQKLDGKEFESEFAAIMRRHGYVIEKMASGADGGVDIAAVKDGKKVIVQCKATQTLTGPSVVRDLYGTMVSENADEAVLASIAGFSGNAHDFAKGKPIQLVDLEKIIELCANAPLL